MGAHSTVAGTSQATAPPPVRAAQTGLGDLVQRQESLVVSTMGGSARHDYRTRLKALSRLDSSDRSPKGEALMPLAAK